MPKHNPKLKIMKIINPFYDNAFEYMMDNERIAKIVLSIILDKQVIDLQSKPQDSHNITIGGLNLVHFEYKAVICSEAGEHKTVLIEVHKYKNIKQIPLYGDYLEKKFYQELRAKGRDETAYLPLINIFLLDFDLPETNFRALRLDNKYYDVTEGKEINIESPFLEYMFPQYYTLITVPKENLNSHNIQLEKFLNLFTQKLPNGESNIVIDIEVDEAEDAGFKEIVTHLQQPLLDEELLRKLQIEI